VKRRILLAFALITTHARAQGCAQCLDSTGSTPPTVQAAYRHAIILLITAAIAFFTATIIIMRRNR
jgi:hypothetical protein